MTTVEISNFRVRPFGLNCEDLDIDFKRRSTPYIGVSVLAVCLRNAAGQIISPEIIWTWSIKLRLQLLLRVAIATQGKMLDIKTRCTHPECGELFEVPLDLNLFAEDVNEEDEIVCRFDDTEIRMRLPNGLDQLDWLRAGCVQPLDMAGKLILSINGLNLSDSDSLKPEWLKPLSDSLEQHDRLTVLQLHTQCPACQASMNLDFDLERQLLDTLALCQSRLVRQIHRLAMAYHWSETEIMALTFQRRHAYLTLLEEASFA